MIGITTKRHRTHGGSKRLSFCFELYDVVRIDHFRGFDEYYSIPYGDKTAVNGSWKKGPGMDLFHTIEKKIGRKIRDCGGSWLYNGYRP